MEIKFRAKEHARYVPTYRGVAQAEKRRTHTLQQISTESHFWWKAVQRNNGRNHYGRWGRIRDTGGPFESQKIEIEMDDWRPFSFYRDYGRYGIYDATSVLYPSSEIQGVANSYEGAPSASTQSAKWQLEHRGLVPVEGSTLDSYGATAISRTQPTSPVFDGATTVAELLSERRFFSLPGRAGGPAGEYLNVQLGVLPAVGAYQDFRKAIESSERVIQQLERDSGKLIRRRYTFPEEIETSSETVSREGFAPPFDVWNSIITPDWGCTLRTVTRRTTQKWFSGAFTYYLPKGGWRRTLSELDRLYGVKPGIDTGWELVPFSFVADYFVNAGDVLGNLNAFAQDGLVMPYGYMMVTQKETTEYTYRRQVWEDNSLIWKTITGRMVKTTLQRQQANPFGFGISDNDLDLRQMSILAALGISRR